LLRHETGGRHLFDLSATRDDQLVHDVALQNLPVLFAIDRTGVVGADEATHIGAFDFSYMT